MARRRRKTRARSNSLKLPVIGSIPINPLVTAAVVVLGEPILDKGWNMVASALPIPTNIGPFQADDVAKFMFAPKVGGMIGGKEGQKAGQYIRIISAVRAMDGLLGGVTSGMLGGAAPAAPAGGDDF